MSAVLFIDGNCRFCTSTILGLARTIKPKILRVSALQSEAGKYVTNYLRKKQNIHEDTIIILYRGRLYLKSDAVIQLCQLRGGVWRIAIALRLVPCFIRDFVYDRFGVIRYRIFGRHLKCLMFDTVPLDDVVSMLASIPVTNHR